MEQLISDAAGALVFRYRKVVDKVVVPDVGGIAISMNVDSPLKAVQISMASPDIFSLHVTYRSSRKRAKALSK